MRSKLRNRAILLSYFTGILSVASAQDTLRLSLKACDELFLKNNLLLLAEKLEISKAEALYVQASLWPNPSFTLDEVNLWATTRQLSVFGQELPPWSSGGWGKNQQMTLALEQLIQTAGKRRKLMALEKSHVVQANLAFRELLLALGLEVRQTAIHLLNLQSFLKLYEDQVQQLRVLTQGIARQVEQGNARQSEYLRLKALELEFSAQLTSYRTEFEEAARNLRTYLNLPETVIPWIISSLEELPDLQGLKNRSLASWVDTALSVRPDFLMARALIENSEALLAYEKAQRVPDVSLKVGYDRGGNFMYNFIGFGVALDLPVFNRNQGRIAFARSSIEQARLLYQQKNLEVRQEVALAYRAFLEALAFFEQLPEGLADELDKARTAYWKNYQQRNVSLIEFIDFMNSYMDNKRVLAEAVKNVRLKLEDLYYASGQLLPSN